MNQALRESALKIHTELWPWLNPGSRLFYGNIIVAFIISVIFLVILKKQDLRSVFNLKRLQNYWLNPSALVDYQVYIINGIIKVLLFAPVVGLSYYISKYTVKLLFNINPEFSVLNPSWISISMATVLIFLWDDFLRFIHHYFMHKVEFLWQLHKTHHSAKVLNPITLYRIHPLESLIASFRNALSLGIASGFLMFLFLGKMNLLTLFGVNIFAATFNLMMGNLRHSHIDISFGFLENFFISPKQHQIHHSNDVKHFNKNFGVALSIWDRLFGTLQTSKGQVISSFGVDGVNSDSLMEAFWPWVNLRSLFKIKPMKTIKLRNLVIVPILLINVSELKANKTCDSYLVLSKLVNQRLEYFTLNRFLTVSAYNVSVDYRSHIPSSIDQLLSIY